ncbi:hypothetical protein SASPL_156373 [Salvia splendens]|uniref:Uncharacterized protein n=1 Tax=Salvia splendens TaxID=180675 RepID=A0A8X8VWR9_SALSN|nr:hypothetical protein SASPL_156373 [Salvia splendens]
MAMDTSPTAEGSVWFHAPCGSWRLDLMASNESWSVWLLEHVATQEEECYRKKNSHHDCHERHLEGDPRERCRILVSVSVTKVSRPFSAPAHGCARAFGMDVLLAKSSAQSGGRDSCRTRGTRCVGTCS